MVIQKRRTDLALAEGLGKSSCIEFQGVSATLPKPHFELLEHSVYEGRRRLGRYIRIAPTWYAAFDAEDRRDCLSACSGCLEAFGDFLETFDRIHRLSFIA